MKNLVVAFGLSILLAAATLSAEIPAEGAGTVCQQENGLFTFDHPTYGKEIDLTQFGLDWTRKDAGEVTTPAGQIEKCAAPEAEVGFVNGVKDWFKRIVSQAPDEGNADRPRESGDGVSKSYKQSQQTAKSGDFEAVLIMTQDPQSILTSKTGLQFTMLDEVASMNVGEGIEALLVVRGCSVNQKGHCLVTADYVVKAPGGSIYQEALNTDVWKENTSNATSYKLTNTRIGLMFLAEEDVGLYEVAVNVLDNVSNTQLSLSASVLVNPITPEESEDPLENVQTNPFQETSSRVYVSEYAGLGL
jgi:hypothetical protein